MFERIRILDDDVGLTGHEGGAGNDRCYSAVFKLFYPTFKNGVENTRLAPGFAGLEFAVGMETRELSTGACAAR